jgi:hypothetical protein
MRTITFSCDANGCKFQTQDKKAMITYIKYVVVAGGKKGKPRAVKQEEHFCSEECLRKAKGFKELTVQK